MRSLWLLLTLGPVSTGTSKAQTPDQADKPLILVNFEPRFEAHAIDGLLSLTHADGVPWEGMSGIARLTAERTGQEEIAPLLPVSPGKFEIRAPLTSSERHQIAFELAEPVRQTKVLAVYRINPQTKDVSELEVNVARQSQATSRTSNGMELAAQTTDVFGYTYDDSATYSWVSADRSGSLGPDEDDGYGGPYDLGFTFEFYGIEYDQFYIGTNGFITFGSGSSDRFNDRIPYPSWPNNLVAPFWDDLNPSAGGQTYYRTYGSAPNRYMVVEWYQVPRFGTEDNLTFEVILYEGNNDIKFSTSRCPAIWGQPPSA